MRFQGLAVVLAKKRWPELIARQRKKDLGLDAYAPASLAPDGIGKGLAVSITPTLNKISTDAETATENFADLKMLLFATSAKVGNADRKRWEAAIKNKYGVELFILEREEIITLMMMPENALLCVSFLHLELHIEPQIADLIERTRRAARVVTRTWASKTKGHPLVELTAVRIESNGEESAELQSLEQIDGVLSESGRIVLEGPAGRGKTTTLIQLAQRSHTIGTAFIVELPMWTASGRGILEFIAGMPAFQAENLTAADLARVQQEEPFHFLLNGWNEIADSNSAQAGQALRELERAFPSAGIIVATRAYHLMPPLPGAQRLQLRRLLREQRTAYLNARLGTAAAALLARIDADRSLDELTCTPFILSEVTSLFEAGAEIPSTKFGILTKVLNLQEERGEHRNALQAAPIFGLQTYYLKAMAAEMTRSGGVSLYEPNARAICAAVTRDLVDLGQIESVGAPTLLATLTAHHVLERVDYPRAAFQFEHQQLQEFYAALHVLPQLLDLCEDDREGMDRFTADYVNAPVWEEPLRMIAEALADQTGDGDTKKHHIRAGKSLVEMALAVDLVFAGELAHLCGPDIWNEVRTGGGERFRAAYEFRDEHFREYALAAMLATGSDDFSDIIVPLVSGPNQQVRLTTYRLWSQFHVSSLGPNWRDLARNWDDDARVDFVSEVLHERVDEEVAAFAAEDSNPAVKEAAASGLLWMGSHDALIDVLSSMDAEMAEDVLRRNVDLLPAALRPQSIAAMRRFIDDSTDLRARLATTLALIEIGEEGLDEAVKDSLAALTSCEFRDLGSHYTEPALAYLRDRDPAWLRQWVASRVETYLEKIDTTDPDSACAERMLKEMPDLDADSAAHVFVKLREMCRRVDGESGRPRLLGNETTRKLESLYRGLPGDVAATGILRSVKGRDSLDLQIATELISRVARANDEAFRIVDDDLRASLRAYLKSSVEVVLGQDDFDGNEKANMASSLAQVGYPDDMADLVKLIRADIERMRRGRSARAAGDPGPVGNGGCMSYAGWHVGSLMQLDPEGAVDVLVDFLSEPEYVRDIAAAMAIDFLPKPEGAFSQTGFYDLIWAARDGHRKPPCSDSRRTRFAEALNAEIARLKEQDQDGKPASGLREFAKALAAIDGHGSAQVVLELIEIPGEGDEYVRFETAKLLLMAGVVLPATTAFALVDSILERSKQWLDDSDKSLALRILALFPFFDEPEVGIARLRDMLGEWQLDVAALRTVVPALSKSHSEAAFQLLLELASDPESFEKCPDEFLNSLAVIDTPRARELLVGFVDPDISGLALSEESHVRGHLALAPRLVELSRRCPEVAARLRQLCEVDLPDSNRLVLAEVMKLLGTPESIAASISLADDAKRPPVPRALWEQLENTFVERRPDGKFTSAFTQHARAANELRGRLFVMTAKDEKRRKSATMMLGQIERWRLEYGRPADEPRHPDFASRHDWPPRPLC
ncbi:hypothetical protein EDC35_103376 [Thiobaca trueperi]|uniref:NACHT C-terminal Alpha/Beta 2 domain-containing protein n=2 Tax=Thiobaca trueperi TaxID=127458 RepID=A0A4R3N216_9GAMM|nr:hypothetical protein EDC35_103376 [Thiobaca trueperi]